MKIIDLINMEKLLIASPKDHAYFYLNKLINNSYYRAIVVLKDNHIVGLITQRDISWLPKEHLMPEKGIKISEIMTSNNLVVVSETISPEDAIKVMHKHRIEKLLICDKSGFFLGLLCREDLDDFKDFINYNNIGRIIRAIEFPEEYKQAGISILNYFGEILRKKYPNTQATVQIKQNGLKISMTIVTVDGDREIIEKTLNEYGLVITGKITPEQFTDDRLLIMDIKSQLNIAKAQIDNQKMMLEFQKEISRDKDEQIRKKDIRIDRFLSLMECALSRDVNVNLNVDQHHGDKNDINAGQDVTYATDQGKAITMKESRAGVVGDGADVEGGIG
ncbi:CBS domain-containing protein [Desulfonema limicola]|uniref:CBS domain-containing protein n=1 Tax=Desulfonema limicola TaxID=45656 RepID=A0A975B6X1_9BACT|nr:CBS domain-containing protein [Desulfonema limicola]QTA79802.1 CBS domain-containing protein [Desulfonema limicola]